MTTAKDRLLELTGAHIRLLTELEQVLDAEAAALGRRQLAELQSATDRKSELLTQIENMTKEFSALCQQVGVQPQKGGLIGANVTAVMSEAWARMCRLLEQCDKKNRSNGIAINASRNFAENLLSLLRGQAPTQTYGRSGTVYGSAGAKALGSV